MKRKTMWKSITISDFPNICRLCLKTGNKNIFRTAYLEIINCNMINMKIQENDGLPKYICNKCLQKLQDITEFIEMCKINNKILFAIYEKNIRENSCQKIKVEEVGENVLLKKLENGVESAPVDVKDEYGVDHSDSDIVGLDHSDTDIDDSDCKMDESKSFKKLTPCDNQCKTSRSSQQPKQVNHMIACKYCGKNCKSNQLKLHIRSHRSKLPFKCYRCNRTFLNRPKLNLHKQTHHYSESFKCDICEWVGRSRTDMKRHENKHNVSVQPEPPPEIIRGVKIGNKWKCLDCNRIFGKKCDLQRHCRIHTGFRPFSCTLCEKKFTQKSALERHIASLHSESQLDKYNFECYICERKFVRKDHLEAHIFNVHIKKQNDEPFDDSFSKTCKLCGKNFSITSYLKYHLTIHEEIKPNIPKIRKTRFSPSTNLCSFCGKSFEKRKTYQAHMRRNHSLIPSIPKIKTEKPEKKKESYQCWHCGRIFTTNSNLKVHVRIHTGEKPYECKFCHHKFAAYSSWHEHENIHTDAKPYQCDHCNRGFRQRGSLRKHLRSAIHRKM